MMVDIGLLIKDAEERTHFLYPIATPLVQATIFSHVLDGTGLLTDLPASMVGFGFFPVYDSLYLLLPLAQSFPPLTPSPMATTSLFCVLKFVFLW